MASPTWHHEFVLARRERAIGREHELKTAIRSGDLERVARGVYRRAEFIDRDPSSRGDDDYLARIRAAHLLAIEPPIFAGMAAARVWGLPALGVWPERVSVAAPPDRGGRSNVHLARSYVGYPPPSVTRGGLQVTVLARTVVDVARLESFDRAVVIADAALAPSPERKAVPKEAIAAELDRLGTVPGAAKARGVIEFADGASGSVGESCSRAAMRRLGLPVPVLQQEFGDVRGRIGYVDFFWPQLGVIGEFDGRAKYVREEFTGGEHPGDVVAREKEREDRLRALGFRVVRWGWREARTPALIEGLLRRAGVTPR